MNDNIVELHNVVKIYGLGKGIKVEALRGVDLKVKRGEFISIQGPSGSGKTTLLNMIGGLDKPTSGRVIIDGVDITDLSERELSQFRREKIGFVFQFFNLIPLLTALENVELPMVFAGKLLNHEIRGKAMELLRLVGLEKRINHKPAELSGGEQQRVAIARALANDPAIILADEPTGNIDQATGRKIIQLIQDLNETLDQTFIVVTHDPAIAEVAKQHLYLIDGRIERKPIKTKVEISEDAFLKERKQLLLAELRWLRSSLNHILEGSYKLSPKLCNRVVLERKHQLDKIKKIMRKYNLVRWENEK